MAGPDGSDSREAGESPCEYDLTDCLFDVKNVERDNFWDGRALTTCNSCSVLYVGAILIGLFGLWQNEKMTVKDLYQDHPLFVILLSLIVSAGPPAFFWFEARAFDHWLNAKFRNVEKQKRWRETYKLNSDNGKDFWKAILAVFGALLVIKS